MTRPAKQNCISIVKPFVEATNSLDTPKIQVFGGVGSVALMDRDTLLSSNEDRITVPGHIFLSNYRNKRDLRDVEALVLSNDEQDVEKIETLAKQTIGNNLKIEIFGFADLNRRKELLAKPLGYEAIFESLLSDRYTLPDDQVEVYRMLFPFITPIPTEALKTWTLELEQFGFEVPVPAPGAVILNYLNRSISGLRSKDATKIETLAQEIFFKLPDQLDWIIDGPGKSQFEMARILHTLREPLQDPRSLILGGKLKISPLKFEELYDHPAFMLRDKDHNIQTKVLKIAALKSKTLHKAESVEFLVAFYQRHLESIFSSIIHNKSRKTKQKKS